MGKIVLEDFNEGNGYYRVNLAYLSKKQVEEIEALVSTWNPTDEDIKSCIGMCLTDANEQRFKDYNTNLKDCLTWLEKQGNNLVKNGYTKNNDYIRYADKYSHEIWHKLMDNFKNIKDYHIGCNDVSDIVLNAIIDAYNWFEKQVEQKSAWSEEDEKRIFRIKLSLQKDMMAHKHSGCDIADLQNCEDWLMNLYESHRVQPQPKQEWSERDKEEKVDDANKVEPKDYNSIDPHFGKPAGKVEPKFHEGEWVVIKQ